ncbi:hypothetical protein [Hymenobacter crusticola]|uniref:hypothetical protein n=1 Tax=Hymenobacter crusticola TaxID=1770526 RepID=UPI001C4E8F32|nr:hypothetical protein [Hymenobacter crusticola]
MQLIKQLKGILLLERRETHWLYHAAGSVQRLSRRLHRGRHFHVNRSEAGLN